MHDDRLTPLLTADRRALVRAAERLLGPAEAEDAVQEAYVRALEAAPALNAAQAWLLTVVRHLAVDRLRRRAWLRQWLEATGVETADAMSPSAESTAALGEAVIHALRLLASRLSPIDGAIVLLHEVFEVDHAEIARAGGKSEAASRQQLRRALARLKASHPLRAGSPDTTAADRTRTGKAGADEAGAGDAASDAVFRQFLESLRLRDPGALWAMLRQPPIRAAASARAVVPVSTAAAPRTACGVLQVGGELGLVLTLDGVTLCVLPLGVLPTGAQAGRDESATPA